MRKIEVCFSGEVNCNEGKVKSITSFITEKEYEILQKAIEFGYRCITFQNVTVFTNKIAYIKCEEVEDE